MEGNESLNLWPRINQLIDIVCDNAQTTEIVAQQIKRFSQLLNQCDDTSILTFDSLKTENSPEEHNLLDENSNNSEVRHPQFPQINLTPVILNSIIHRNQSPEKERIKQKLAGFDPQTSLAVLYIHQQFGNDISHAKLTELARFASEQAHVMLDRDSKRRKSMLLKWFHDNWLKLSQYVQSFKIPSSWEKVEKTELDIPAAT